MSYIPFSSDPAFYLDSANVSLAAAKRRARAVASLGILLKGWASPAAVKAAKLLRAEARQRLNYACGYFVCALALLRAGRGSA